MEREPLIPDGFWIFVILITAVIAVACAGMGLGAR